MENKLIYLPVAELFPHPDNPRKNLGELDELADSIRQNGVMQNLTVVPREDDGYTVIIGHRRLSAAKMAGLTEVPCVIVEMSPREQLSTMLLENMQRSDLTVYEQAQGFQMLMNIGETVETISEQTGFSKTTVKRRLKMAELDQDVLKEVSSDRQISLGDLDKLSQIEDIEVRNETLKSIGTANFNQRVETQLKRQTIAKKLPLIKAEIEKLGAKKIERSETYGGKYSSVGKTIYLTEWSEGDALVSVDENRKLFYYLEEDYGTLSLYVKTPKAAPVKRSEKEIEREKYIADVRQQLDELSETAYKLRSDFASKLVFGKQNERKILDGAVDVLTTQMFTYLSNAARGPLCEAAGMEWDYGHVDECRAKLLQKLDESPEKFVPMLIYHSFGDSKDKNYYSTYSREFPVHGKNFQLDMLYKWLVSLGYEMSDDERGLQDGTHPLLMDKDKVKE